MNKIGVHALTFIGDIENHSIESCLSRVAKIGYDVMELPLLNPDEHLGSNGARRWYFDKLEQARNADLLMAISGSARNEGIVNLPSDADHVIEIGQQQPIILPTSILMNYATGCGQRRF